MVSHLSLAGRHLSCAWLGSVSPVPGWAVSHLPLAGRCPCSWLGGISPVPGWAASHLCLGGISPVPGRCLTCPCLGCISPVPVRHLTCPWLGGISPVPGRHLTCPWAASHLSLGGVSPVPGRRLTCAWLNRRDSVVVGDADAVDALCPDSADPARGVEIAVLSQTWSRHDAEGQLPLAKLEQRG